MSRRETLPLGRRKHKKPIVRTHDQCNDCGDVVNDGDYVARKKIQKTKSENWSLDFH